MFRARWCIFEGKNPWLATNSDECVFMCQRKILYKATEASFKIMFPPQSLRFSKSKRSSSDWVVTMTARPHPHLHCIFLNLPAQKGTIKRSTKQMRFPYIRRPCNHISHVVSFPICYVLSKLEPECRSCIRRVTVQPGAGLPALALHTETFAPAETSHLVHLQTTLQVETL